MSESSELIELSEPLNILYWNQNKLYSHSKIEKISKYINENMNGMLPLFGKEKKILLEYSSSTRIPYDELVSIRSHIRTQKEIFHSRFVKNSKIFALDKLKKISDDENITFSKFVQFIKNVKIPPIHLFKIISKEKIIADKESKIYTYYNYINKLISKHNRISLEQSKKFEETVEKYLESKGLSFKTEDDIRNEKIHNCTPDILFNNPVKIVINGNENIINWIDAKNYMLTDTKFIIDGLNKQSEKYRKIFGQGAFLFHYGIDNSVTIPDTILISSTDLD